MRVKRVLHVVAPIALLPAFTVPAATAADRAAAQADNPWVERRVLNIAHQGGEIEAPSNTLFAFKTAVAKGADVLELDVHATADGELVVIHDPTVDRTTDGTGRVDAMTLGQLKELDAAYYFVPGCGTCGDKPENAFAYRGFATGARPMPARFGAFEPNDFRIPTLREVFEQFPDELINIEIKRTVPDTTPYEDKLAALVQEYERSDDTIVVSFYDLAVELFKVYAPEVSTATGTGETGAFVVTSQGPAPGAGDTRHHAFQVPLEFEGVEIVNQDFVDDAHANGLAVHVWTINDEAVMTWLIDLGVDGIMTDRPTLLEKVLRRANAPQLSHRS